MKCELCASDKLDSIRYGEFLTKNGKGVHTKCLYLSSGLRQSGKDDQGFLGFVPKDIAAEHKRISNIQCCYCGENSANIGCCETRCYRNFHTICGLENGAMNQFLHTYRSFCHKHVRKTKYKPKLSDDCGICYDNIFNHSKRFRAVNILRATCCRNGWFHKYCLQKYAKMAGYFFKCPLCNDSQRFKRDMSSWGIFIHEKDADWELEPNAFAELLERPSVCAAQICNNAEGRGKKKSSNPFIFCLLCGSVAMHRHCVKQKTNSFECDSCKSIVNAAPISSTRQEQQHNVEESEQSTAYENSDVDVCGNSDDEYLSCDEIIRPSSKKRNLKLIITDDEYEDVSSVNNGIIGKNMSEEEEVKTDYVHEDTISNCMKTEDSYTCNDEVVLNDHKGFEHQVEKINTSCIAQRTRRKSMAIRPPSIRDEESGADETSFTSLNLSSDNSNANVNVSEEEDKTDFVQEDTISNCMKTKNSYTCNDEVVLNAHKRYENQVENENNIQKFGYFNTSCIAQRTRRKSMAIRPPSIRAEESEAEEISFTSLNLSSDNINYTPNSNANVNISEDEEDKTYYDHEDIITNCLKTEDSYACNVKIAHKGYENHVESGKNIQQFGSLSTSCIAQRTRRKSMAIRPPSIGAEEPEAEEISFTSLNLSSDNINYTLNSNANVNISEEEKDKTYYDHEDIITNCLKTEDSYACNDEVVLNAHKGYENQVENERNIQKFGSFNTSCIAQRTRRKSMAIRPPSVRAEESEAYETNFTSLNISSDNINYALNSNANVNISEEEEDKTDYVHEEIITNCMKTDNSYACNDEVVLNAHKGYENHVESGKNIQQFGSFNTSCIAQRTRRKSMAIRPPSIRAEESEAEETSFTSLNLSSDNINYTLNSNANVYISEEKEDKTDYVREATVTKCIKTEDSCACNDKVALNAHKGYENHVENEKNLQQFGTLNTSCIAQRTRRKSMAIRPPSIRAEESEADETSFTSLNLSSDKIHSTLNSNANVTNYVISDHSYACIVISDDDDDDDKWVHRLVPPQQKTDNIDKFQTEDKAYIAYSLLSECEHDNYAFQIYCAAEHTFSSSLDLHTSSIKYESETDRLNTTKSSYQSTKWYEVFQYDDGNDKDNEYNKKIAKACPQRENTEPKTLNAMDNSSITKRTQRRSSFKKQSMSNGNSSSNVNAAHSETVHGEHSSVCSADSYQAYCREDNATFDYEADEDSEAECRKKTDEEKQHCKAADERLLNYFHQLLREVKCNSKLNLPSTLENENMKTEEKSKLEISCVANRTRRRSVKAPKKTRVDLEVNVEKPIHNAAHNDKTVVYRDTNFSAQSASNGSAAHHKNRANVVRSKQREAQKRKSDLHASIPAKKAPLLSKKSNQAKVVTNILQVGCIANRTRRKSVDANTYLRSINAREKTNHCTINAHKETKTTKAYNSLSSCDSSTNDLSTESAICENSNDCDMPQPQSILPTATRPGRRSRTVPRRFLDSEDEYVTPRTSASQEKMPKLANWMNVKETTNAYLMPKYKHVNGKLKRGKC